MLQLSGGMKRRVLIAKALSHEPDILFLDEPSAGVDVELRHDMWRMVRGAARRAGHHHHPDHPLHRRGRRHGRPHRRDPPGRADAGGGQGHADAPAGPQAAALPAAAAGRRALPRWRAGRWRLSSDGLTLTYTFDAQKDDTGIAELLAALGAKGIHFRDLRSSESSLEEIFVGLVKGKPQRRGRTA
jgi:ABC-2 type transport system ATP-binding protein